jgi:hypothetical protein
VRLIRRQPASHLEIWCLSAGIWLAGTALLLALGVHDLVTLAPLTLTMIIDAGIRSHRLNKRRERAAVSDWLDSHPRPRLPGR